MAVPILLLDVDGVINFFPDYIFPKNTRPPLDECHKFEAEGFAINVQIFVIDYIRELHNSGRVEIRWLTTWGALANLALAPHLNLPEFQVQAETPADEYHRPHAWWKLDVVRDLIASEPDRRVIWIDDELHSQRRAMKFVDSLHDSVGMDAFLAISPDPDRGIRMEDLMLVERFSS